MTTPSAASKAGTAALPKLRYLSAWFCPYAHRSTIALEHHAGRVEYEWVEVRVRVRRAWRWGRFPRVRESSPVTSSCPSLRFFRALPSRVSPVLPPPLPPLPTSAKPFQGIGESMIDEGERKPRHPHSSSRNRLTRYFLPSRARNTNRTGPNGHMI